MVFPVVMYGCESWTLKKTECWRIDAFELWCWRRLLRVPWTCREIQSIHPKGDQSWMFIGRTDVEAETPVLWPPDAKNWLIWKDPDAWIDWGQEEKWTTEDEMVGWHHRLNGHGFGWTLGVGDDREAWHAAIHGVTKSWTRLSDWTELNRCINLGSPGGSDGKESACNVGDLDSIPGLGRSPGGGHGNPLQYSCLESPHGQRGLAGYRP